MLRCVPTKNWDLNGSAEISYNDNAFTPMDPRQLQHYRVHTLYRPKPWATISGAYNDLERHNNTYNTGTANLDGPLQHQDHSRYREPGCVAGAERALWVRLQLLVQDVYITTNVCYSERRPRPARRLPQSLFDRRSPQPMASARAC